MQEEDGGGGRREGGEPPHKHLILKIRKKVPSVQKKVEGVGVAEKRILRRDVKTVSRESGEGGRWGGREVGEMSGGRLSGGAERR